MEERSDGLAGIRRGEAGFNLVEVVLALLVVAVGLISVFGLFPAGLNANQEAIGDTHCAEFAEEVFCGLRAEANRRARAERLAAASGEEPEDADKWENLAEAQLALASWPAWVDGDELVTEQTPKTGEKKVYANVYANYSYRTRSASGIENHALRYRLEIDTNVRGDPNIASALLYIWPGEFGREELENARVYYSEFYKFDI